MLNASLIPLSHYESYYQSNHSDLVFRSYIDWQT